MRRHKLLFCLPVLLALLVSGCNFSPEAAKRRYLETGNKYFKNGKYKEASIMYRRAIQKDLKFGEAYYRLGLTEMQLQRYQEAIRALRRSMELDPKNIDAHAKLADFLIFAFSSDRRRPAGILNEIRDIANGLLKTDPKSFQGLRIRGLQLVLEQKLKEAVEVLRAANQVQPLTREATLPLVEVLLTDGQNAEAEQTAKAMIQKDKTFAQMYDLLVVYYMRSNQPAAAEEVLKQKVANNPKEGAFRLQLAVHYYSQQRRPDMVRVLDQIVANPKDFPKGYGMAGEFYFRIREFDQAIQQYQLGERASPKDRIQYRVATAEVLAFNNKKTEAAQLLDSVLKEDSGNDKALSMRASLRLQTGNPEQIQSAINDLQSVIRRSPQNFVLRFESGRAHLAKGDVEQARMQFQEAVRLRPDYVPPRLALAQLDLSKGDFSSALQGADKVLTVDPGNLTAKLIRSSALIGMGDKSRARDELQATLKVQPSSRDAQFQMAMLNFSDKQYRTAEEEFRRLNQMSPPDPRGLMGLVEVQIAQLQFDGAIKMLEGELERNPDRPELRLYLANTCVRAGKLDAAIGHYRTLLVKYPKRDDVHLRLGETLRRAGNISAAIEATQKAQEIKPADPMINVQYALLLEASGRRQEAKPMYERVLKVQPDNPIALNNLAFILAESGADLDQALTLAQRAKQKLPQDPNVSDTLGWIYIKKNLSDNAIQIFQELLLKHPGNPIFRYHLAMALFQKGDKPRAKKELETALKSKPAKEDEIKIKDLMARIG
ncbi:MAG: tetratricopeptide repeat protein [Acidobacteria bacterium]|nr:tetratricopeptide repeat protein [Acidobacteriota bacterium]